MYLFSVGIVPPNLNRLYRGANEVEIHPSTHQFSLHTIFLIITYIFYTKQLLLAGLEVSYRTNSITHYIFLLSSAVNTLSTVAQNSMVATRNTNTAPIMEQRLTVQNTQASPVNKTSTASGPSINIKPLSITPLPVYGTIVNSP
jgi:hypothetical protein